MVDPSAHQDPAPVGGSVDAAALVDQLARARVEVQQLKARLDELKQQDALTGLPNRLRLVDRMEQAILLALRQGHQVSTIFIELDRFKSINQTLGFEEVEELLRQVSRRLAAPLRLGDTLAGLGGDQFAVLLPELKDTLEPSRVAQSLQDALRIPFRVGHRELHLTASIGISLFPQDGDEASTLLKQAESAAVRARAEGGDTVRCTTPTLSAAFLERRELETYLSEAIVKEELKLYYQPQFDARGTVTGVEALLRWQHPLLGLVPPSKFIPLAEENHVIHTLGDWVLRESCRQVASWQPFTHRPLRLAVNVSTLQVGHPHWVDSVARTLRESRLSPFCLELEITESALLQASGQGHALLKELKALGARIAIDDFGTGYSSLSYLHRLPIDTLKIDRSFVSALHPDQPVASSKPIVQAILHLGQNLGLDVVAEGVETEAQKETLLDMRCTCFQGFLFGHPMEPRELEGLLEAQQAADFDALVAPDLQIRRV